MGLLKTKVWTWYDIGLLKWCVLLFGMVAGALLHEYVRQYIWLILAVAVLLAVRPTLAYFRH